MFAYRLFSLALLAFAGTAQASTVSIDVRGPDGKPLAGAVVTVESPRFAAPAAKGPYAIEQRDISFQPHVLIVPVGATVSFPNRDKVRHHVYSFSKPKKFDLKLYGREDTRTVAFDKPGAVALGCNIHDAMSGFVYVVSTPYADQADAAGHTRFDVPAGPVSVRVWHPSIRSGGNALVHAVMIPASGFATTVSIKR
jgi:plastocyanin